MESLSLSTPSLFGISWNNVYSAMVHQGRKERWIIFAFSVVFITAALISTSSSSDFSSLLVLIACKIDRILQQPWWIVLSPIWSLSILLLIIVSCIISIASKGMLIENQEQQRYRKLRTGYATSILVIVIIIEVLWFLWIEDILQTYLLVVFIPMYIWAVFYIVKMVILYLPSMRDNTIELQQAINLHSSYSVSLI